MKQPHEDITGTDRSGDPLLSLDPVDIGVRDAIIALASHLRRATLVGNPAPMVQKVFDRMEAPRPGDLVVELSVARQPDPEQRMKGLGYLVETRREWWTTDEVWEREQADGGWGADDERPVDTAWYVQYGPDPADICRWTNCQLLMAPTTLDAFTAAAMTGSTSSPPPRSSSSA